MAASDIAVASRDAVFAFSEVKLGIIPAVISPFALAKIGPSAARRYFVTGERFDAETALRIGLVHEVADDLDAAVDRVVGELLSAGPQAARWAKRLVRERPDGPETRAVDRGAAHERRGAGGPARLPREAQAHLARVSVAFAEREHRVSNVQFFDLVFVCVHTGHDAVARRADLERLRAACSRVAAARRTSAAPCDANAPADARDPRSTAPALDGCGSFVHGDPAHDGVIDRVPSTGSSYWRAVPGRRIGNRSRPAGAHAVSLGTLVGGVEIAAGILVLLDPRYAWRTSSRPRARASDRHRPVQRTAAWYDVGVRDLGASWRTRSLLWAPSRSVPTRRYAFATAVAGLLLRGPGRRQGARRRNVSSAAWPATSARRAPSGR